MNMDLLIAYVLGLALGFMTALDIVKQAKEAGFRYDTKYQLIKWAFTSKKETQK